MTELREVFKSQLSTSRALIDQFLSSLETGRNLANFSNNQSEDQEHPSSLLLLAAASTTLKNTTTKLSLLTITAPFTHTAVSSLLRPLNESILPSLVTACLLTTSKSHPKPFVTECVVLTQTALRDLKALLALIEKRCGDGKPKSEISEADKQNVTDITGRVWEDCDVLLAFANEGVPGFVVKKSKEWLALMKDAVQELQEWDPSEDIDDDDIFGDGTAGNDGDENEDENDKAEDEGRTTILTGVKDQALRVLSRIPQSIHVVVKQRLEKFPRTTTDSTRENELSSQQTSVLSLTLSHCKRISECIDESAEGMYLGDPELCLKKAGEARALTIEIVEAVLPPWNMHSGPSTSTVSQADSQSESSKESKEDVYIKRALQWIQQVETRSDLASSQHQKSKTKA